MDGSQQFLASPLTTALLDPVTGLLVPGSLQPIANGVDIYRPQSLGIGPGFLPRVIPRNGVIQLEFSSAIDAASVSGDVIDASGALVPFPNTRR